ncbi:MAG: carboxypeptidase regulatory-like domain-containing protein [Gammaproteobacteria bacterium]
MKTNITRVWAAALALSATPTLAGDFISGRVVNADGGAEAGVWVIAETDELATPYRKIVVTDDDGRFNLPQLPAADYRVWVRGYGLEDSARREVARGAEVELVATRAADAWSAAQVYPASHWLALFELPPAAAFGGAASADAGLFGGADNAPARGLENVAGWAQQFKLDCVLCHQLGAAVTRLPGREAFDHGFRKAAAMSYFADTLGRARLLDALGAWGAQLATGVAPPAPSRPAGIERNVVITQWAWGDGYTYAHDEIATDKRQPTVNANGPVYGVDLANDFLLVVDPVAHTAERVPVPTREGFDTPWCEQTYQGRDGGETAPFGFGSLGCPWPGFDSAHAGRYDNPANPHNPMMDGAGRVWLTTQIRRQWAADLPDFCRDDPVIAEHRHHRQLGYYDPARAAFTLVDSCYGTHHLQFGADGRLWTSGDDYVVGWLDPDKYDPARPETLAAAQGYSEVRVDSDGDGAADRAIVGFHYGVIPNPLDGSAWSAVVPGVTSPPGEPGYLLRYDPGSDRHEAFAPPAPGMGPRGVDVDSSGMIWTALGGSSQLARFDRSKCRQTWGTGGQCPEGWALWRTPGPGFRGRPADAPEGSTDMHYYLWVDQFDTLGLGRDVVIVNGTNSDALIAFDPRTEQFTTLRIPYPLNTYTRGLDGRIDDPGAGWKGRGLWFTNGLDPILHSEVPRSYVGKIQLRPDPLAH